MLEGLAGAADHEAKADLEAPDSAGGPDVEVVQALRLHLVRAADGVAEVAVAAIDEDVAWTEERGDVAYGTLGYVA